MVEEMRALHSIELKTSVLRKAAAAAAKDRKALAQWLEEAILEKARKQPKGR